MNLYTGKPPRQCRQCSGQPLQPHIPEPVRKPVEQQRMQPRIIGQHLEGISCRRIAMEYAADIFPYTLEHDGISALRLQPAPRSAVAVRCLYGFRQPFVLLKERPAKY